MDFCQELQVKKAIAEYSAIAKSYGLFTANTVYKTNVQGNQAHREKDSNSQDDSDGKNGGKGRDYQAGHFKNYFCFQ
jgi:hypothetical protein